MNGDNNTIDYALCCSEITLRMNFIYRNTACTHTCMHNCSIFAPPFTETYLYPVSKFIIARDEYYSHGANVCVHVDISSCKKKVTLSNSNGNKTRGHPLSGTMVNDDGPLLTAAGKPSLKVSASSGPAKNRPEECDFRASSVLEGTILEDELK